MYAFLDYHLQTLAQKVKFYIKETNRFWIESKSALPDKSIFYLNLPSEAGLSLCKFLETRDNKQILSETLVELAEVFLKNHSWWKGF